MTVQVSEPFNLDQSSGMGLQGFQVWELVNAKELPFFIGPDGFSKNNVLPASLLQGLSLFCHELVSFFLG
jgi:hypothetical protein